MRRRLAFFLLAGLPAMLAAQGAPTSGLDALRAELLRLAPISGGTVGVGMIHLESGRELFINADTAFPMASTFKVPVALTLLDEVQRKRIRLDSMITLEPHDLHPGSGTISNLLDDPGVALSVRNLTELMLLISDNSATDIVLRTVGGGRAVNARLADLGIPGISVDRPTNDLIADAIGVRGLPPEGERTLADFNARARALSDSTEQSARRAFYEDRRDTATPVGMTRLLARLWRGELLGKDETALLLDIMFRCETGTARIKGLLPPGIRVAHKTGTLGIGVANDVGIIELPGAAGHVALAVFIKQSTLDAATQERAIAQIARAVYDFALFTR
jgi:beta-lactamase class A